MKILRAMLVVVIVLSSWIKSNSQINEDESPSIQTIKDHIEYDSANPRLYSVLGWLYHRNDSLMQALHSYSKALTLEPNNPDLFWHRGGVYRDLGEHEMSVKDYSSAIALAKDSLDYYISRGAAYEKLNRYDNAWKDYTLVINNDPSNE